MDGKYFDDRTPHDANAPSIGPGVDDNDQQQFLFHKERMEAENAALAAEHGIDLATLPPVPEAPANPLQVSVDTRGDHVCQHGTAMDVHCCNCHSGFIFETDHVCPEKGEL